jgi:hypothetical protein
MSSPCSACSRKLPPGACCALRAPLHRVCVTKVVACCLQSPLDHALMFCVSRTQRHRHTNRHRHRHRRRDAQTCNAQARTRRREVVLPATLPCPAQTDPAKAAGVSSTAASRRCPSRPRPAPACSQTVAAARRRAPWAATRTRRRRRTRGDRGTRCAQWRADRAPSEGSGRRSTGAGSDGACRARMGSDRASD